MRRLIESTFVTLGGDIGAPQDWGPPYLSGPEQGACPASCCSARTRWCSAG